MALHETTEIPSTGDTVDYHRGMAEGYGNRAARYLEALEKTNPGERRDTLLNQQIGVNLKLADVHARLALAVANSTSDGQHLVGLVQTIKATGGAVEIGGVRIHRCDEFGQSA